MAVLGIVSPDIGGIFSVFKGIGGTLFETTGLESAGFSGTAGTDCEFKLLGSVTEFDIWGGAIVLGTAAKFGMGIETFGLPISTITLA
jgi:hypothetical protein